MTKLEAEVLAARLTRVWEPTKPVAVTPLSEDPGEDVGMWLIEADLSQGLKLEAYTSAWGNEPSLRLWNEVQQKRRLLFDFDEDYDWELRDEEASINGHAHLLPLFRRGCWLSGCPIDATAHEKAEWVQSFSQEELEAWNLKI